jgi:microcystin-dependent protein
LFAGNSAPKNWSFCDGSLIRVASNTALFSLLGDRYGGDGRTMFGLPDLRGRLAIGAGQGGALSPYALAQTPGAVQVPTQTIETTSLAGPTTTVRSVAPASGNNVQPVLGLNYIICLYGIFPPRFDGNWDGCVGEIRVFAGDFAPANWALCDGSVLSVEDPDNVPDRRRLFEVIGFTYGGDGRTTFALPDLRGRAAVGVGQGAGLSRHEIGRPAGAEQIPTQSIQANTGGGPTASVNSVAPTGANNLQPALVLNFIICTEGLFPRYGD